MSKTVTKIHKFNLFYVLLKAYQLIVFHTFYKRVEVVGRRNIPYGSPIIFTPNHQNALMDALIVLDTSRLNIVFMARADIFKKPLLKKILTFLKIIPIYRIRDGAEELSRNDETFNTCLDILRESYSVCIMPEGNHGDKRRLRPLVKGTFRIAFKSHEEFGQKTPVKIVPVGIDFQHYSKIRQNVLVVYGKPIDVAEYIEAYHENPAKAMNTLKDRLSDEMKKIIIHIGNVDHYDMFQDLRGIYNKYMRNRAGIPDNSLYSRFLADRQMISILDDYFVTDPERMQNLSKKVSRYMSELDELNLRNWVIERKGYSISGIICLSLIHVILFPLFLTGWITNFIPYTLTQKLTKNVKDLQFLNSFRFGLAIVFFLIYFIAVIILIGALTGPAWIPWSAAAGMFFCGYFALNYLSSIKKIKAAIRFRIMKRKEDSTLKSLIGLHEEIITEMNSITDQFMKAILPGKDGGQKFK